MTDVPANLPPTTTLQEDTTTAGQRRINLIWEITQSVIAILVVSGNIFASLFDVIYSKPENIPVVLSSSLFMVLGFYLARTNHQAIGGVGNVPTQPYIGR